MSLLNVLIGLDQTANAAAGGNPDETISSRALVKATTDDELAFIIAHEMAHFERPGKGKAAELAADMRAVEIARKAGFDPAAGARYLRRTDYFRPGGPSHPTNECRALAVEALEIINRGPSK